MEKIDRVASHKTLNFHQSYNSSDSSENILKRLERKQSRKNFQSPRSRFENKGSLKILCEDEMGNDTQGNALRPSFIDADALGRSICYLSPKNSKISPFLMSPQKDTKQNQEAISINNIKTKILIEFQNERGSQYASNKRTPALKTGRSPLHKKFRSSFTNNFETNIGSIQNEKELKNECELAKEENKQLFNENKRLNEAICKLKEQNGSLQRTLQLLSKKIQQQKLINIEITESNQILLMKNRDHEEHIQEVKESYKDLRNVSKSYDILMHMHHKMKFELQTIKQRNRILQIQNDKSASKIENLLKMLQDSPSTPPKRKISSRRAPLVNKQNERNVELYDISKSSFEVWTPRCNGRKVKDESFFELSPE